MRMQKHYLNSLAANHKKQTQYIKVINYAAHINMFIAQRKKNMFMAAVEEVIFFFLCNSICLDDFRA